MTLQIGDFTDRGIYRGIGPFFGGEYHLFENEHGGTSAVPFSLFNSDNIQIISEKEWKRGVDAYKSSMEDYVKKTPNKMD